jgi:hypothetical protein
MHTCPKLAGMLSADELQSWLTHHAVVQIFCETKRGCDLLTRQLRQDGWPALSIHGDKSQQERDWVLAVSCRCACADIVMGQPGHDDGDGDAVCACMNATCISVSSVSLAVTRV